MRVTLRLLADVKPGRYLRPGHPTGLTGLFNHPSPRSTLIYLYGSTLQKLEAFPEHSVYRQSAEAITKHRMQIIKSIKPQGYNEWAQRASETLDKYPEAFSPGGRYHYELVGGQPYVSLRTTRYESKRESENENENEESTSPEGMEPPEGEPGESTEMREIPGWESEPPLEASQIEDAENKIGAGLIEEVIQVAEGELKLVDTMLESKVWEELEEKPQPGQWDYFARDTATKSTQEPADK